MKHILDSIKTEYLILDGATGTYLQENGLKTGMCPEQFVIDNPAVLQTLQQSYIDAGAKVIYTSTFGGNRKKLENFGLQDQAYAVNKRLAEISVEGADGRAFVAGDVGPTGVFIHPLGDYEFEALVDIYKEQIRALADGGVDLIVIETMIDLNETRAAIIAAKEVCDLPVFATMTFDESGRSLTGSSPEAAAVAMQAAGADAVGLNCSTGPAEMRETVRRMKRVLKVPLMVKPNAGMPKIVDGETIFEMDAAAFCNEMQTLADLGADVVGGCCGTTPDYIEKLSKTLKNKKHQKDRLYDENVSVLASNAEIVEIQPNGKLYVIGERINPTGKKALKAALKAGDTSLAIDYAGEQRDAGADILDINVGVPGIDEAELMESVVSELGARMRLPLCIDSSYPSVVERALRIYPGRALINSISDEKDKADALLPIMKKYGAMAILLPIGEDGIPDTSEGRIDIIQSVYQKAKSYGLTKADFLVDGLAFAVSSSPDAASIAFKVLNWCRDNQFKTVLGVSNASFGLPQRQWINAAYLSAAMQNGLNCAIINPNDALLMNTAYASAAVLGRDQDFSRYIETVTGFEGSSGKPNEMSLYDAVLYGKDPIDVLKIVLKDSRPEAVINENVIPALNQVGDWFAEKKFFLPQLLASAKSAKVVFDYIEPYLEKSDTVEKKHTMVIATVKGDIHDIGKNLVALMLKNHGFNVVDLGKDVDSDTIIQAIQTHQAKLAGLSALMTTTAKEMSQSVAAIKAAAPDVRIMVGGAVVTQSFADEIGADAYAKDAAQAVKAAQKLTE